MSIASAQDIEAILGEILNQSEDEFHEGLVTLRDDEDAPKIQAVRSFADVGMMTQDKGLVLVLSNGSEFQITIRRSR